MVRNDKPEQKYKINFTKYSKGCSFNSIDIGEYPHNWFFCLSTIIHPISS